MATLSYIYGDVTDPQLTQDEWDNPRPIIIPHVVNDAGVMGAGVAKALYTKWPRVKSDYMTRANDGVRGLVLGDIIDTIAESGEIYVASMVAQSTPGKVRAENVHYESAGWAYVQRPPIRYGALVRCMLHVGATARQVQGSIHAPRFGSDLAGGNWETIEQLILELWVGRDIDVTIYDYKG